MATASAERTRPALGLPLRQIAPAWAALVALALFAWAVTIAQARGLGIGPGTMGLGLPLFIAMWVAMMAAMMFPSVAPVAILWSRAIMKGNTGVGRAKRIAQFVGGYMISWAGFGLVAYAALLGTE